MTKQKSRYKVTTDPWGIDDGYEDAMHRRHATPPQARHAILAAMGAGGAFAAPLATTLVIDRRMASRSPFRAYGPGTLVLEDGTTLPIDGAGPPDLPIGYHRFQPDGSQAALQVIVSPGQCYLPDGLKTWGWAPQLYAVRSRQSWGMGDLADLRRLGQWSAALGAGIVLVNPLFAAAPVLPYEPSPYCPSSRRFYNPLYLRIEEIPGAAEAGLDLAALAAAGAALNGDRRIDRDAVFRLKSQALEKLWGRFASDPAFDEFLRRQGPDLEQFATFCALAEQHGRDFRVWPGEYRDPKSSEVAAFAQRQADRVRYHAWSQWLLDRQLEAAAQPLPIMQDLPVGVDPGGADAWAWQDILANNVTVGAPPDIYNTQGQNWGLPPFIPHRLRAAQFQPFIQTIRAALRHSGGLRIDHVMGLFRLFWIPFDIPPADGAYVRYPTEELMAILAIESQRARAFIVGEDLGTVEDIVEDTLAQRRLLSYRVLWFEDDSPATYSELALAAVTTHDLPTIAGLWTGADLEAEHRIGKLPDETAMQALRDNLQTLIGAASDAPADEVIVRTHRALADAPSAVLTATLDDALAVEERPNMPGTLTEWPNWSIALPVPLEDIETSPLALSIAEALNRRSPQSPDPRPMAAPSDDGSPADQVPGKRTKEA